LIPLGFLLLATCRPGAPQPVAPTPGCAAGSNAWIREELFFGRGMAAGGEVSDSAWQRFVESEIIPRFPDGLTILDANGHWRSEAGPIVRERSWVLVLYHPADPAADRKVAELAEAYRKAFAQEAVLRDRDMTCVTL
jgi:hypothetical protein